MTPGKTFDNCTAGGAGDKYQVCPPPPLLVFVLDWGDKSLGSANIVVFLKRWLSDSVTYQRSVGWTAKEIHIEFNIEDYH